MPRVNLFLNQDEMRQLREKADREHKTPYEYVKDLTLKDIQEPG